MESAKTTEQMISVRWSKLKARAHAENHPENLMAILEEIDELLLDLTMRIAGQDGNMPGGADSRSAREDDPGGWTQMDGPRQRIKPRFPDDYPNAD